MSGTGGTLATPRYFRLVFVSGTLSACLGWGLLTPVCQAQTGQMGSGNHLPQIPLLPPPGAPIVKKPGLQPNQFHRTPPVPLVGQAAKIPGIPRSPFPPPMVDQKTIASSGSSFTVPEKELTPDGLPNWEERLLLALKTQEQLLLQDFGPEHPQILSLRARMKTLADFTAQKKASEPVVVPSTPAPLPVEVTSYRPAPDIDGAREGQKAPVETSIPATVETAPVAASQVKATVQNPVELSFVAATLSQMTGVLIGLFLGLLVHMVALLWVVRRLGRQLAPLFRLEVVNRGESQGSAATGPISYSRVVCADEPLGARETVNPQRKFDLGPSYEDELAQKIKDKKQQENAILEEVFQQNVQLQSQIKDLESAAV